MKNVQVYNYYDTWLKGFDNKIENLILSHSIVILNKNKNSGVLILYVFWRKMNNAKIKYTFLSGHTYYPKVFGRP